MPSQIRHQVSYSIELVIPLHAVINLVIYQPLDPRANTQVAYTVLDIAGTHQLAKPTASETRTFQTPGTQPAIVT